MLFFIPFYSIFFIQWFIFLIITYIFHFNPGILENATSFWRYNFHISIILLLIFSYFVFLIIKRFSFVEKKIIINFIAVIIVIIPLVFFGALISLNLGLVNLLPIPALDGGHVVFLLFCKDHFPKCPEYIHAKTHYLFLNVQLLSFVIYIYIYLAYRDVLIFFSSYYISIEDRGK